MQNLHDLIHHLDILQSWNDKNIIVSGISYHSNKVFEGNIFVCIKGYKSDGHKYIQQAISNGAQAVIVEDYQENILIPQYKVNDTRHALAVLSDVYFDQPSKDMKMIGITATNGKTSTSFMVDSIFSEAGLKTGLIGTVMIKYADEAVPAILTTPESNDLQSYLNEMREQNISHVTMEVSSSALELNRVDGVDFDIVALNNISREHIDFHGSFDDYFNAKAKLIKDATKGKFAILNLDCPYSSSLINQTKADVITFGIDNRFGTLSIHNLDISSGRGKFIVEINEEINAPGIKYFPCNFPVNLSVPGYHSVYNSLSAIAVALLCGIPINKIQRGLSNFTGVERRFQFIFEDDYKIIDDHFANTGNINVTLETLHLMKYNNLHLVYAIRGSRGVITNQENAETIVSWSKKLGLTSIIATISKDFVTDKDIVTQDELDAFMKVMKEAGISVHLEDNLSPAVLLALKDVKANDVILLAGCQGMDFGAQIALKSIHQMRPDINESQLYQPLQNRVVGIL